MNIKTKYKIGDIIYVNNDPEQLPRYLIGICVRVTGLIYEASYLGDVVELHEFEISDERNPLALMGISKEEADGG